MTCDGFVPVWTLSPGSRQLRRCSSRLEVSVSAVPASLFPPFERKLTQFFSICSGEKASGYPVQRYSVWFILRKSNKIGNACVPLCDRGEFRYRTKGQKNRTPTIQNRDITDWQYGATFSHSMSNAPILIGFLFVLLFYVFIIVFAVFSLSALSLWETVYLFGLFCLDCRPPDTLHPTRW